MVVLDQGEKKELTYEEPFCYNSPMITHLTQLIILVKDMDEAKAFYTQILGFELHTDAAMEDGFRWLTVCPKNQRDVEIVLFLATTPEDLTRVGSQVGSSILAGLGTDDCKKTYQELLAKGVKFHGEPKEEPWGTGVTLEDLYGNKFYLNQTK